VNTICYLLAVVFFLKMMTEMMFFGFEIKASGVESITRSWRIHMHAVVMQYDMPSSHAVSCRYAVQPYAHAYELSPYAVSIRHVPRSEAFPLGSPS
jgi:hypothetical protein